MIKAILLTASLLFSLAGISQKPGSIQTPGVIEDINIYTIVDTAASFPGGAGAWQRFLNKNLRFPQAAIDHVKKKESRRWTVVIEFVVTKEGKIKNLKPITDHGLGLEEEAMRVLQKSPDWRPARIKGASVHSYTKQPFVFYIDPGTP